MRLSALFISTFFVLRIAQSLQLEPDTGGLLGAAVASLIALKDAKTRLRLPSRRAAIRFGASLVVGATALTAIADLLLNPGAELVPRAAATPAASATAILLSPLFEEHLFRTRVLMWIRSGLGSGSAVLGSSLLFAAAHGSPWMTVNAFLLGTLLGIVRIASGEVYPCIGLHMGVNLGVLILL